MRNGGAGQKWEPEEDQLLAYWQSKLGNKWAQVAKHIPDRTGQQCAQRWRHTNPSISKGKWTAEEDEQLAQLVDTCGVGHWAEIARHMAGRTDQQCLARWTRHLDPSINRGNWCEQEDALLLQLYEQHGSNWSRIAKAMKVRIPHQCRSRFNVLARGHASRSQSAGSDAQQQKRRRKGGACFARIGAARWKKPKWGKGDWEGESDSAYEDECMDDEAGDYHDKDMTNDTHGPGEGFADDAEEAAALLTSFQRCAGAAAAAGHSSGTAVDSKDQNVHASDIEEEQQQEQWRQQERQQQQHWDKWQQRQQQKQPALHSEHAIGYQKDSAFDAAASAGGVYHNSNTSADTAKVVRPRRSRDVHVAKIGQRGSSAGSSKSSSSNIIDISRSSGRNCLYAVPSVPDPAEYSRAIAAAAAIADASSRNTSPEFVQQPLATSGVSTSAAAAAAAVVAALLGSGGLATAAAATTNAGASAGMTANGTVDVTTFMTALSKYAADSAAASRAADATGSEAAAGAGYLSKTGSSSVPAGIAGLDGAVADAATAADETGDPTAVFGSSTVATLIAAGAASTAPGALLMGTSSMQRATNAAAAGGRVDEYTPAVQTSRHGTGDACVTASAAGTVPSSSQQLLLQWLKSETGEQAPQCPAADPLPVLPLQLSCLPQQQPASQVERQQDQALTLTQTPGLQQLAALYAAYMPVQQQQHGMVLPQQLQQPQSILSQALQQLGSLPSRQNQEPQESAAVSASSLAGGHHPGALTLVDVVRMLAAAKPPAACGSLGQCTL